METIIKCSTCNAPLASIIQVTPINQRQFIPDKQRIIANCCHCGDKSWPVQIEGKIGIGNTDYSLAMAYPKIIALDDENCTVKWTEITIETEKIKSWR